MKKPAKRKSQKKKSGTEARIAALEARIAALEARPFVVVQPVRERSPVETVPLPWVTPPHPPYYVGDRPPWGQTWCRTDGNGMPIFETRVTM